MTDPGFIVNGELFPFAESYTLGDTVLVRRLTGLPMDDFSEALRDGSSDAFLGLVGASVWRKHPEWKIDRVEQFVHRIDMAAFEIVGTDEETDADPPDQAGAPAETSTESSAPSTEDAVAPASEPSARTDTGTQP